MKLDYQTYVMQDKRYEREREREKERDEEKERHNFCAMRTFLDHLQVGRLYRKLISHTILRHAIVTRTSKQICAVTQVTTKIKAWYITIDSFTQALHLAWNYQSNNYLLLWIPLGAALVLLKLSTVWSKSRTLWMNFPKGHKKYMASLKHSFACGYPAIVTIIISPTTE